MIDMGRMGTAFRRYWVVGLGFCFSRRCFWPAVVGHGCWQRCSDGFRVGSDWMNLCPPMNKVQFVFSGKLSARANNIISIN